MTSLDPVVAYDVTRNLVENGSIAVPESKMLLDAYRGRDGRTYSPFGIAQSIWNVPFYLVGRELSRWGSSVGDSQTLPKAIVALGTAPAVGLLAWSCFEVLLGLRIAPRTALWVTTLTIVGTPLWPYSGFGFNQPLSALFLWTAVLCALANPSGARALWLSGLCLGSAVLTRHEMLLSGVVLGGYVLWRNRRGPVRALFSYAAGLAPLLVVWCALNWWRFGSPFETGYMRDETPQFGSSLIDGTVGLLFSPYASLLLYCPLACAAVPAWRAMRRTRPAEAWLFLGLFVTLFALYASLGNWMGARSYGPRYLVPLLPALMLPLAFWTPGARVRVLVVSLATLSMLVQLPGVLVDYAKVRVERARAGETVAQDTRWSGTPLLLNTRATIAHVPETALHLTGAKARPVVDPRNADLSMALSFSPDLWWLYLWYLGWIDRAAIALIVGVLGGIAGVAFARAVRLTA